MVLSTVWRSRVELTAWPTSPSALNSPTDRARSLVRVWSSWEQSNILDSDHRLVCKSPKKSDLLVSEGVYFHSTNTNSADRNTLAHQRHSKSCPGTTTAAAQRLFALREFLFGFSFEVMDMYRLAVDDGAAGYRTTIDGQRHRWQWPV